MKTLHHIRKTLIRHITSIPGWRTNRKIVVIESDDWGSIRMPSKEVYEKLSKTGISLDHSVHNKYDSLADEDDLYALFDILLQFKDIHGNPPVITANAVMTNPDFEKIKQSEFQEYHYELFTETLKRHPNRQNAFNLWVEGHKNNVFFPQFHGHEHLNSVSWMKALQNNDKTTHIAFNYGFFGHTSEWSVRHNINFLSALDFNTHDELVNQKKRIIDGLNIFKEVFGYFSHTFIAPRYIWSHDVEPVLKNAGVDYLQGTLIQLIPYAGRNNRNFKKELHYQGEKNKSGQRYGIRNCFFEPALNKNFDWVSDVMQRMRIAFFWGKPVVICSHRINFIGNIEPENRRINLMLLKKLLFRMQKQWPEIEFMNSSQLGYLMEKKT